MHTQQNLSIYQPRNSDAHPVSAKVFFEEFAAYLESVVICCENVVIAGDFNSHLNDLLDHDTMKFTELLESFGLENHVAFPTHINGHWLDRLSLPILTTSNFCFHYHILIYLTTVLLNIV